MVKTIDLKKGLIVRTEHSRLFKNLETGEYYGCETYEEALSYFVCKGVRYGFSPIFIEIKN